MSLGRACGKFERRFSDKPRFVSSLEFCDKKSQPRSGCVFHRDFHLFAAARIIVIAAVRTFCGKEEYNSTMSRCSGESGAT